MANIIGNNGDVTVGANVIAEITDWTLDEAAATADDTVLGDTVDSHKVGTTSWSGTVNCYYDSTDSNGQEALTSGASVTLHLRPAGAGAGNIDYNGTASITGISKNVSRNNIVTVSFTYQGNGALTRSVLV